MKEDRQIVIKLMKICSSSVVIREILIKNTMKYHPYSLKDKIKSTGNIKSVKNVEKLKHLKIASENKNIHQLW